MEIQPDIGHALDFAPHVHQRLQVLVERVHAGDHLSQVLWCTTHTQSTVSAARNRSMSHERKRGSEAPARFL